MLRLYIEGIETRSDLGKILGFLLEERLNLLKTLTIR